MEILIKAMTVMLCRLTDQKSANFVLEYQNKEEYFPREMFEVFPREDIRKIGNITYKILTHIWSTMPPKDFNSDAENG